MKSKNICRIKFGLTRIVALFMTAAMLIFGVASCSSDSGDGGDETKTYFIKVEKAEHGTVVASAEKAEAGKTITLVATAEDGYVFEAYSVKDANENSVEVKDGAFKMPASDVIVSATFKEEEKAPDTPATVEKFTVTFDVDGTKTTQSVESGKTATEPEKPSKTGYTFDGWYTGTTKFNFATEITGNITLTAKWTPATNTAYKVLHYKQNAENDEYTLSDTENLTGTTGEQTTAEAKTYAHFTAGTVTQAAIAADGSTEIKIYYKRETVTFTLALDGGKLGEQTGTVTKTGKYGQSISVADPTRSGYTFSGWNTTGGKIPATFETSATYTALWTSASGINVTIAPASTISVVKSVSDDTITLTADSGFTGYTWLIDGTAASGMTGATVSEDGKTLTLATANLTENAVYQVSLSATKDGIPYGAQISVKKEPARN